MENVMNSIKTPDPVFEQIREQPVNADLILPDYYPEISKILDCGIEFSEEAVTVTADKISISGAALIRLMYTSAENELKVFTSVCKYSKIIPGGNFEQGDICIVKQTKSALNYKAVSPRKVDVNAVAAVKVNVYRLKDTSFISEVGDPRLQARKRNIQGFSVHTFSTVTMEFTENVSLPVSKALITGCLRNSVKIAFTEIRAINNKVMLTGTAEIGFVYITKENNISAEQTVTVPFTQVKDLYGVQENDICCISLCHANADIGIKENGEENADITVTCRMLIVSGVKNELCMVDDVYAVKGSVNTIKTEKMLITDAGECSERTRFEGEILTYDNDIRELTDKYISDITYGTNKKEGCIEITGTLEVKLLAKASDGTYYCLAKNISFAHTAPVNENCLYCMLSVTPGALSVKNGADGKISFSGDLYLDMLLLYGRTADLIKEIAFEAEDTAAGQEKIVLYYGTKGEEIWNIAKENKTPLTALKELNTLNEDVLSEDRLLVFRS